LGNVTIALQLNETNSVVDGIQISHGQNTSNRTAIVLGTATATYTVRKCRLLNTSSVDIGIGNTSALNGNWTIENNLIVGFDVDGIRSFVGTGSPTRTIRHNTIYGDGTASNGINCSVTTGSPTFNVKGNAVANSGSGVDLILADTSGGGSPTNNYADNATEQFNLGTTNEIDLGATTDAWTSPGTTAASDFTVKNTSSALYNAVNPTLVTTDITDFTRDGTNHDVGAFEFQAGGTDVTATPSGAAGTSAVGSATVSGGANVSVSGASATAHAGTVTVSMVQDATAEPSGVAAQAFAGEVTVSGSAVVEVSGAQAQGFVGNVVVSGDANVEISGVQVTSAAGEVTISTGTDVTAEVTGVSATAFAGDVTVTGSAVVEISGVSGQGLVGEVTVVTQDQDTTVLVTGVSAQAFAGDVTVPQEQQTPTAVVIQLPQRRITRQDATVEVRGVRARAIAGRPSVFIPSEEENDLTLLLLAA
jgi:hypothetical protein